MTCHGFSVGNRWGPVLPIHFRNGYGLELICQGYHIISYLIYYIPLYHHKNAKSIRLSLMHGPSRFLSWTESQANKQGNGQSKQTKTTTKKKQTKSKQFETNKNKQTHKEMENHSLTFNFKSVYVSKTRSSGEPFTAKVLQESLEVLIQAPMITKISAPSNEMILFPELPS